MNSKDERYNGDIPSASVFFPQTCTHMAHDLNNKGELRSVLVTGGDRLVFLKDGVRVAESGLLFKSDSSPCGLHPVSRTSIDTSPAELLQVKHISICPFSKDKIRVVMVTTNAVCVFEVNDSDCVFKDSVLQLDGEMTPKGSQAAPPQSSQWDSSHKHPVDIEGLSSSANASTPVPRPFHVAPSYEGGFLVRMRRLRLPDPIGELDSLSVTFNSTRDDAEIGIPGDLCRTKPVTNKRDTHTEKLGFPIPLHKPYQMLAKRKPSRTPIVTAAFMTEYIVCLVYNNKAILVDLGLSVCDLYGSSENVSTMAADAQVRIVWRSMGAYTGLAVCRFSSSVALSMQSSTIIVFPANVKHYDIASSSDPTVIKEKSPGASMTPFVSLSTRLDPSLTALSRHGGKPLNGRGELPANSSPSNGAPMGHHEDTSVVVDPLTVLPEHGLTASLGIYRIHCMEWHCVSTHTLLCVTCVHPYNGVMRVMLYTIHSIPTVPTFSNTLHQDEGVGYRASPSDDDENDAGISSGLFPFVSHQSHSLCSFTQLVPMGVIPFTHAYGAEPFLVSPMLSKATSSGGKGLCASPCPSEMDASRRFIRYSTGQSSLSKLVPRCEHMTGEDPLASAPSLILGHTGLIPSFSYSSEDSSLSDALQFLNVDAEGTVWTSCYRSGLHRHSSSAVQRAQGLTCAHLLAPLFRLYGTLYRMDVLPMYKYRALEMGTMTPQSKLSMSGARRYRFVGYFDVSGIVAVIMVDLSAATFRVESFLAAGSRPILSLCTLAYPFVACEGSDGADKFVAALFADTDRSIDGAAPTNDGDCQPPHMELGREPLTAENHTVGVHGCWGIAIFSHRWTSRGFTSALIRVSPFRSLQQQHEMLLTSMQNGTPSSKTLGPKPTTFPPVGNDELSFSAGRGATHSMQHRCLDKTLMSSALLGPLDPDMNRLPNLKQGEYDACLHTENALSWDERGGESPHNFRSSGVHSNAVSDTMPRYTHLRDLQYALRGGCVMPDGECLFLSAFYDLQYTREKAISTFSSGMQSSSHFPRSDIATCTRRHPAGFLILLAPAELESPDLTHPNIVVGGARIARAAPATLIPISNPFFQPRELAGCLGDDGIGESKGSEAMHEVGVDFSAPALRRITPYLREIKGGFKEVQCEVVTQSSSTEAGVSTPVCVVRVRSPTLPPPWVELLIEHEECVAVTHIIDIKGQLVMNDTVVGVVVRKRRFLPLESTQGRISSLIPGKLGRGSEACDTDSTELFLYGIPAMQPDRGDGGPVFELEAVIPDVGSFLIGPRGEVLVQHRCKVSRWLRCFPGFQNSNGQGTSNRYSYIEDVQHRFEFSQLPFSISAAVHSEASQCVEESCGVENCNNLGGGNSGDLLTMTYITEPTITMTTGEDDPVDNEQTEQRFRVAHRTHLICSFVGIDYLRMLPTPFASDIANSDDCVRPIAQYHPESVMQLIGMERWRALGAILSAVAKAARACVVARDTAMSGLELEGRGFSGSSTPCMGCKGTGHLPLARTPGDAMGLYALSIQASTLAHELCTPSHRIAHMEGDQWASCTPSPVSFDEVCGENAADGTTLIVSGPVSCHSLYTAVDNALIQDLRVLLPKVSLYGLSSRAQLDLVCIVEALGAAHRFGLSLDEAASRFFFFFKLNELRRRLQPMGFSPATTGPGGGRVTILQFATDRTAARVVTTMSYLWASMSDSQASILRELLPGLPIDLSFRFSKASMGGGGGEGLPPSSKALTWELLEKCGVAFWVKDHDQLRVLADAVAREQFRATKSIPNCALMYCVSGNTSTLVALCKERKESRLHGFYSRDFREECNRRVAAANAYAALGKNLISYAASFFLLAGDLRSAVQVILQRQQNPSLALFVLRASVLSEQNGASDAQVTTRAENLQWFLQVWRAEMCGVQMDLWIQGCLYWLMGRQEDKINALQCLARHPTGHPEVLCILRHARRRVVELSQCGKDFLSFECEIACLLRLGRYCQVHRLDLNAQLHYANVQRLLRGHRISTAQTSRMNPTCAWAKSLSSQLIEEKPKTVGRNSRLQADYNTGTLIFEGFNDDESGGDEDEKDSTAADSRALLGGHKGDETVLTSTNSREPEEIAVDISVSSMFDISKRLVDMVEAEIAYAMLILRGALRAGHCASSHSPQTDRDGYSLVHSMCTSTPLVVTDTGLYNIMRPLLLSVMQTSPTIEIEGCLTNLLVYLMPDLQQVEWSPPSPILSSPLHPVISEGFQSPSSFSKGLTHVVFVMVLFLSLSEVATRSKNQSLACALAQVSCYQLHDLTRGAIPVAATPTAACVHPVVAFWSCLYYHLGRQCLDRHGEDNHTKNDSGDAIMGGEAVDHAITEPSGSDLDDDNLPTLSPEYKAFYQTLFAAASNQKSVRMTHQGSAPASSSDAGRQLFVREVDLLDWHFAWFSCHMSAHILQVLRRVSEDYIATADLLSSDTQLEISAGVSQLCRESASKSRGAFHEAESFDTQNCFGIHLLLCCSLIYATLRFDCLAADCYTHLQCFQSSYVNDKSTAPNGVLVEARLALTRTLEALCALLRSTFVLDSRFIPDLTTKAGSVWGCYGGDITLEKVGAEEGLKGNAAGGTFADFSSTNSHLRRPLPACIISLLVQLCRAHAELFFGLPSMGEAATLEDLRKRLVQTFSLQSSGETGAVVVGGGRGTRRRGGSSVCGNPIFQIFDVPTSEHDSEGRAGCGGGCGWELARSGLAVLQWMESSWQRLNHTHRSFRNLLLMILTKGTLLDDPLVMERLLLNHSSHSIRCLDFDYSSCESLVWATEAGLSVSHGFRELLARDHEDALKTQTPERNMATAAFSRGFEAQLKLLDALNIKDGSPETTPSPTAATLAARPRASIAPSMYLTSHPHLPFFLSNHPDGHLDLYPFASSECIASYLCPGGSCATTPVSFSTNGSQFAVGLQDGSIAGWRFTAVDVDKALMFWLPSWFLSSQVKAVFFCGEQTSMVVAVGSVLEPHRVHTVIKGVSGGGGVIVPSCDYRPQMPTGATCQESRDPYTTATTSLPSNEDSIVESGHLGVSLQESMMSFSLTSAGSVPSGQNRRTRPVTVLVSEILVIDTALKVGEVVVRCALPFTCEFAIYLNSLDVVLVVSVEGFIAAYMVRLGKLTLLSDVPLSALIQQSRASGISLTGAHSSGLLDGASAETITSIAASPYDPILALGTSSGFAMLLTMGTVSEAIRCRTMVGLGSVSGTHGSIAKQWDFMYVHPTQRDIAQRRHDKAVNRVCSLPSRVEPLDSLDRLVYHYEPRSHHSGGIADYALKAESVGCNHESVADASGGKAARYLPLIQQATRVQMAPFQGRPNSSVLDLKFAPSVLLAGLKDGSLMAARLIPESLRRTFVYQIPSKMEV